MRLIQHGSLAIRSARRAFTLIEMLVVIGIIATIIALGAAAVMQVIAGQERKNTELAIKKTSDALQVQMRAALNQARELKIPDIVNTIAADPTGRRATVIWQKLQIKRHFPMTYLEALNPATVTGNTVLPSSPILTALAQDPGMQSLLVFRDGLKGVPAAQFGANPRAEMGAMLNLIFVAGRKGSKIDVEQELGPTALDDTNGDGVREIVDLWGQPFAFYRFPTDYPDFVTNLSGDPGDPERTLMDVNWNNQTNYNAQAGVYWFEELLHLVHDPSQATWTPRAWYSVPVVASSGFNRRLGLLLTYAPGCYSPGPPPTGSPNWCMTLDPLDLNGAFDNIYSFTLK